MSRSRRRSNSFRGESMHDSMRGACDVIAAAAASGNTDGSQAASSAPSVVVSPGASSLSLAAASGASAGDGSLVANTVGWTSSGSVRRPPGAPPLSQLTIKDVVRKRNQVLKLPPPTVEETAEFFSLVDIYITDDLLKTSRFCNDAEYEATRRQITDLAVRIHAEYQRKEENSAKLSESEFALKAIVDDVISRLMLRDQVAAQKGGQV